MVSLSLAWFVTALPLIPMGRLVLPSIVQMVNEGFQVFNKTTGASVLGPLSIASVWSGFGGVCQSNGHGDPVALYDQLANRWLISQFAGTSIPTDECIAVSTTSDATGTWNRYGFHLGSSFFDYPKIGVWPDAYYMAMNVFNSAGTAFLGPQPFAFNRAAMLAGTAATFVSTGITGGPNEDSYLPADLEGNTLPPAGAPELVRGVARLEHVQDLAFPCRLRDPSQYNLHPLLQPLLLPLHPDLRWWELRARARRRNPRHLGDRLMFRAADRFFPRLRIAGDQLHGQFGGVAAPRWVELRNVTAGPVTVAQESTYQPDTTWRWMGSIAQDSNGNMVLGFSASSSAIIPQIRYAGRLGTDPINTLAQGEAHLFDGTGSQASTGNRWGDYSRHDSRPGGRLHLLVHARVLRRRPVRSTGAPASATSSTHHARRAPPTPTPTGTPPTATATATLLPAGQHHSKRRVRNGHPSTMGD